MFHQSTALFAFFPRFTGSSTFATVMTCLTFTRHTSSSIGRNLLITTCMVLMLGLASGASAQRAERPHAGPVFDSNGHTEEKIVHRIAPEVNTQSPFANKPHSRGQAPTAGGTGASWSKITYHGGKVMDTVSKIVIIWYGNWQQTNGSDNAAGQQIIRDAIYGLSLNYNTFNYAGITTGYLSNLGQYTQSPNSTKPVTAISSPNIVEVTVPASSTYGTRNLSDSSIFALVKSKGGVPDPNAIYLVLSSSDIGASSGFLSRYCGWHTSGWASGVSVKYGFVGNPNKNLNACAPQTVSPNGNPGVDAMVSVIAHELIETVTDPELDGWYNGTGMENSDMCTWTYGSAVTKDSNGAYWNVSLPTANSGVSRNYLLQRQLSPKDSKCYINATGPVQ